jgi:hypothetical protein
LSAPVFEEVLARLYSDRDFMERFVADPAGELAVYGLTVEERDDLSAIDRTGLLMAAKSYERKRSKHAFCRKSGLARLAAIFKTRGF